MNYDLDFLQQRRIIEKVTQHRIKTDAIESGVPTLEIKSPYGNDRQFNTILLRNREIVYNEFNLKEIQLWINNTNVLLGKTCNSVHFDPSVMTININRYYYRIDR